MSEKEKEWRGSSKIKLRELTGYKGESAAVFNLGKRRRSGENG